MLPSPELFPERFASPIIIDGIQYAPGLLPYIKMRVDQSGAKAEAVGRPSRPYLRFLIAVAASTGQILRYADLGRDVGIGVPTAKQWLSLLITSGIVCLVEPWFRNTLKRMIKAPKIYFRDAGLCAYLTRWTNPEALEAGKPKALGGLACCASEYVPLDSRNPIAPWWLIWRLAGGQPGASEGVGRPALAGRPGARRASAGF